MARPKATKKTATKKVAAAAEQGLDPVAVAEAKVREAEEKLDAWFDAKAVFETEYPEAQARIEIIEALQREAKTASDEAKKAVSDAGQTVGNFKLINKSKSAFYDGGVALKVLLESYANEEATAEEVVEYISDLYKKMVVTGLAIDSKQAEAWKNMAPKDAAVIEKAYNPRVENASTAVTVPYKF